MNTAETPRPNSSSPELGQQDVATPARAGLTPAVGSRGGGAEVSATRSPRHLAYLTLKAADNILSLAFLLLLGATILRLWDTRYDWSVDPTRAPLALAVATVVTGLAAVAASVGALYLRRREYRIVITFANGGQYVGPWTTKTPTGPQPRSAA